MSHASSRCPAGRRPKESHIQTYGWAAAWRATRRAPGPSLARHRSYGNRLVAASGWVRIPRTKLTITDGRGFAQLAHAGNLDSSAGCPARRCAGTTWWRHRARNVGRHEHQTGFPLIGTRRPAVISPGLTTPLSCPRPTMPSAEGGPRRALRRRRPRLGLPTSVTPCHSSMSPTPLRRLPTIGCAGSPRRFRTPYPSLSPVPRSPTTGTFSRVTSKSVFDHRVSTIHAGLDLVVEVRSKWFASRAETRQDRCDQLRAAIVESVDTTKVGVYLSLPVAAWSQGE